MQLASVLRLLRRTYLAERIHSVVRRHVVPGGAIDRLRSSAAISQIAGAPFYRRYAGPPNAMLPVADPRGAVSLEHGFFYNRIPKAANSTVTRLLVNAIGVDAIGPAAKHVFKRPSELSKVEVDRFAACFKFTVVRNPYERVLSAYLDKIARRVDTRRWGEISDFYAFCRFLDGGALHADPHWAPQIDLLLLPTSLFDLVVQVEHLSRDLPPVFEMLGLPAPSATERYGPPPTQAGALLAQHYDDTSRSVVARLYERDFAAFGYSM